ncbi:hypothetical protein FQN57_001106 [Myotisia sp. PD_48]|nr:hypothetical protein FQN57_001106 [Myotisia sp. PD_48]
MMVIPIILTPEVAVQREAAWSSVKDTCVDLLGPKNEPLAVLNPTKECGTIIDSIISEYPEQVAASSQINATKPCKIKKYLHAEFVYFPGDILFKSFTIIVPLRVSGNVKFGEEIVDENHYYYVLNGTFLSVASGSRLEAISISNIE